MELSRTLSANLTAPRQARETLSTLQPRVSQPILDDVRLVTTELVTNVVRHSGLAQDETLELRVFLRQGRLRVEIRYAAPAFDPVILRPDLRTEAGRGLFMVDRLAHRWGVTPGERTRSWAEWDLAPTQGGSRRSFSARSPELTSAWSPGRACAGRSGLQGGG